ncbi:serine aminopeptidase domain-containing protein [Streptomyces sp. NBC_01190]|uniref:serine aminopeptidase domain-containing protein n=1 Tax=Streptomyces sp. NBC_01190 TaxID=2903767 RepID=UPI0038694035|nr:lysophospholipase [Streptomyces sp. NBC_01190]
MTAAPGAAALNTVVPAPPAPPPADPAAPPAAGDTAAHWYPAEGLLHRGTIVLLPGRGEHPGVYERFGRRLAADAYVVHVLAVAPGTRAADVAAAVDTVAGEAARPLVLAGSDTGALHALAAAVRTSVAPDALLLAGVPAGGDWSPGEAGWTGELDARTTCPTHRGRLADDPRFAPGALTEPVPAELAAAAESALAAPPAVPALLLHGAADPVAPAGGARALAARLPASTLATVADGRHDTFNDIQHRTVAALVVQWLERLRASGGPLLSVEGTAVF